MTVTQPAAPVCPECGGTNTMVLSDGQARCFDDSHEWDPTQVTAMPRPPVMPFAMASVEEVFGPPPDYVPADVQDRIDMAAQIDAAEAAIDAAEGVDRRDELIGGTARLEGGQLGTVLTFPDDDHVVVRLNDGRDELVPLSVVEHITPRAPAFVVEPAAVVGHPPAEWIQDVAALSDLIIKAGLATIYETADGQSVGAPPTDWLPRDESSNALVEAAAALAVARLVIAYELDVDDILEGTRGDVAE